MSYVNELMATLRTSKPIDWRSTGSEFFSLQPMLVGYAVVWNTLSNDRGGYRLRYSRSAFWRDVFRQTQLDIRVDHDERRLVGRTHLLDIDAYGLWIEGLGGGDECSRFMWQAVNSGALAHYSIGASAKHGIRGIVEAERGRLREISLTTCPAMPCTSARLRDRWENADRLRDLLVIDNASLEHIDDNTWLAYLASKAVLRLAELNRERIPRSPAALQRRVELYLLSEAA